jgi:hypothetical protein
MAAQLTQESRTLAQHWSGATARRAQAQFQLLHTQTATLAAQATRTGSVLAWLGTQVVPAFRDPSDARQAQQYLTSLSAALIRANGALPPEIGVSGTAHLASATPGPAPANPSGPASPSNPAPSNPATLISTTSNTSGGPISPTSPATTTGQTQPAPLASRLQSATPAPSAQPAQTAPETPAGPAPSPAGAAGAPAPLISRITARPARARQTGGPRPVDQDSGLSGGALPLQPATNPASPPALTATQDPAGRNTLGALPMAGGVSSQSDHERHRESWAPEDRNPWGLPDTCVPPLIEGP